MTIATGPFVLAAWIDRTAARLTGIDALDDPDFLQPLGEPSLVSADSVSWQVFRNPVTLLVGGIVAVVLELGNPSVRAGVDHHSSFRSDPMLRLRRTGRATMVTVYGARSRAEALISRICAMHRRIEGMTANGERYRADDPVLLNWVHATASYGFLKARHAFIAPIDGITADRFYREGQASAQLYGALGVPDSALAMERYIERAAA